MSSLDDIFKAYDIRGVVPDQLDADLARKIGAAFAAFAKSPTSSSATTCARRGLSWWRRSPTA